MRKDSWLRSALLIVLIFGLLTAGTPAAGFADDECVASSTQSCDDNQSSGNDATQNPLSGDLGGSPAPEITHPSETGELMRNYLKDQIMSGACAAVEGAQTGSAISSALRWAIGAILTVTGNAPVGVPLMLGSVLTLGMHLGLLEICNEYFA